MHPAVALNAAKPAGATLFPARARVASSMRRSALLVAKQRRFRLFHAKTGRSTAVIASRSNAPLAVVHAVAAIAAVAAAVAIAAAVVVAAAGVTAVVAAETGVTAIAGVTGATAGNRHPTDEIAGALLRSSKTTRSQSDEDVIHTPSSLFVLHRVHSARMAWNLSVIHTLSPRLPPDLQVHTQRSCGQGPGPAEVRSPTACAEHALTAPMRCSANLPAKQHVSLSATKDPAHPSCLGATALYNGLSPFVQSPGNPPCQVYVLRCTGGSPLHHDLFFAFFQSGRL